MKRNIARVVSRVRRFNGTLIVFWSGMLVMAAISYPLGLPELVFLVVGAALSQALTWLRDRQLRDVRLRRWTWRDDNSALLG